MMKMGISYGRGVVAPCLYAFILFIMIVSFIS